MGTDIHPSVEVRRNGVWRYHTPKRLCEWYAETYTAEQAREQNKRRREHMKKHKLTERQMEGWPKVKAGDRINLWDRCKYRLPECFGARDYTVFAVLAGVRSHADITPIQEDRGLPNDVTRRSVGRLSKEHSEGYVTLAELKAYDYGALVEYEGVINGRQFSELLMGRNPDFWQDPDWMRGHVVTPEYYAETFDSPLDLMNPAKAKAEVLILAQWKQKLPLENLTMGWIPYLERLVPRGGSDDDVRVIFDFDS